MKHLAVINPRAGHIRGRVDAIIDEFRNFFRGNPRLHFDMHITRWKRDAAGYVLRYVATARELVRVYAVGGNGTLFEVINGIMGLPNAQVAWYPAGRDNSMIYALGGKENISVFRSIKNICFSPVITIDTIQAGHQYTSIHAIIGGEAEIFHQGEILSYNTRIARNVCYSALGLANVLFRNRVQRYHIETDKAAIDCNLSSILITNVPCGIGLMEAAEARFNDGCMDLFTLKRIPKDKIFDVTSDYLKGCSHKWPEYIDRYRCKKLKISSDSIMSVSIDGEFFYESSMEFEIFPRSLDFVCPPGISTAEHHEERKTNLQEMVLVQELAE